MSNLVEISDFTGSFTIARDTYTKAIFDEVRDEYQFKLIYQMLGGELGQLFIADLDANGVPQTSRFTDIYNAFNTDGSCGLYVSEGIKKMVIAYVYFYWVSENNTKVGITGNTNNKGENSDIIPTIGWMVKRFNRAIATAKNIQWYIGQNSSDYPEYEGVELEYTSIY